MRRLIIICLIFLLTLEALNGLSKRTKTLEESVWTRYVNENLHNLGPRLFSNLTVNMLLFSFKLSNNSIIPVDNFFHNDTFSSRSIQLFRHNKNLENSNLYGLEVSFFSLEYQHRNLINLSNHSLKPIVTMFELFIEVNSFPAHSVSLSIGFGYVMGIHIDWKIMKDFIKKTYLMPQSNESYNRYYSNYEHFLEGTLLKEIGIIIENVPIVTINAMIRL